MIMMIDINEREICAYLCGNIHIYAHICMFYVYRYVIITQLGPLRQPRYNDIPISVNVPRTQPLVSEYPPPEYTGILGVLTNTRC